MEVDVSTYAHYEKGDRTPNAEKLAKLANYYGLDDEMLGANYPIEAYVSYDQEDLDRLKATLKECVWVKGDYNHNRRQYSVLKDAVKPILIAREEALLLAPA